MCIISPLAGPKGKSLETRLIVHTIVCNALLRIRCLHMLVIFLRIMWPTRGVSAIEIINNTRGGIEDEIWERGNGWQIEILDQHHTIFGLHLQPEKFKTRVTKLGVLYVLHVISTNITPKF